MLLISVELVLNEQGFVVDEKFRIYPFLNQGCDFAKRHVLQTGRTTPKDKLDTSILPSGNSALDHLLIFPSDIRLGSFLQRIGPKRVAFYPMLEKIRDKLMKIIIEGLIRREKDILRGPAATADPDQFPLFSLLNKKGLLSLQLSQNPFDGYRFHLQGKILFHPGKEGLHTRGHPVLLETSQNPKNGLDRKGIQRQSIRTMNHLVVKVPDDLMNDPMAF